MSQIRIRFSLEATLLLFLFAALALGTAAMDASAPMLVLGALVLLLAVLQLSGVVVVVTPEEVAVRNALRRTVRRVPIEGLSDLLLEGPTLRRASDGRRITGLGRFSARGEDVEVLRTAISPTPAAP